MKIALVILHADSTRGGAERYTIDLAAALVARGHDVSLLATSFGDVPANVARIQLEADAWTRKGRYLRMLDALDAHLDRHPYSIVHAMLPVRRCHVYHPHAGLAVEALFDKRLVTRFNPRRTAMGQIEQQSLHSSRPPRVLCLSQYVKQSVLRRYPLGEAHVPILFNAVDLARFNPGRSTEPRKTVNALIIAQDFHRKGLMETLTALSLVSDPSLKLKVVGKEDPAPFRRHAKLKGIADRVDFAGPTSDPVAAYAAADFFVLPTKHDPCSLVVLEALAMGMPVISTRFNGACEIMTDGVHGFVLADPQNVNALADSMRKMLDPALRARMSAACLELRPQLSYEHHLNRLVQIYEQVL